MNELSRLQGDMYSPTIHVGLPQGGFFNEMRMGMAAYRDQFANWTLFQTGPRFRPIPDFAIDGGIIGLNSRELEHFWKSKKVPVVNVSAVLKSCAFSSVLPDNQEAGRIAASHFLERQFDHMAYVGQVRVHHSSLREQGFREGLSASRAQSYRKFEIEDSDQAFFKAIIGERMTKWLKALPKPCAIFCSDDNIAVNVLNLALADGWEVPAQLAILGVNNDEVVCSFARRPLSSIILNGRGIGFEAGRMMGKILEKGKPFQHSEVFIRPLGVASRLSTDITAHHDPIVARALQMIRNNITQPINAADVAQRCGVSRRLLERQFKQHLEHGPYEEITRQRMRRAKRLLRNTDWPIKQVAESCGYPEYSLFATNFSKREGISPNQWRKQSVEGR